MYIVLMIGCHRINGSGVPNSPASFATLLALLVKSPTLFTAKEARLAFEHLATPDAYLPSQAGAFLTALRLHQLDTRPDIIAAAATVMRNHAISVTPSSRPEPACDIVGTGGDGKNTFNVSTSAAIVAAAAGALVYKVSLAYSAVEARVEAHLVPQSMAIVRQLRRLDRQICLSRWKYQSPRHT